METMIVLAVVGLMGVFSFYRFGSWARAGRDLAEGLKVAVKAGVIRPEEAPLVWWAAKKRWETGGRTPPRNGPELLIELDQVRFHLREEVGEAGVDFVVHLLGVRQRLSGELLVPDRVVEMAVDLAARKEGVRV